MKRVLLLVAAAGLLVATPSCKKGENDPALSLKSRKSRLAGDYNVSNLSTTITDVDEEGDKTETILELTQSSGKQTRTYTAVGVTPSIQTKNVTVNKLSYTISKDGTWSRTMDLTYNWSVNGGLGVDRTDYTEVTTSTQSGTWSFLGGQTEEFKNKERVMFSILKSDETSKEDYVVYFVNNTTLVETGTLFSDNETWSEGENFETFELDMLKSKEITMVNDLDSKSSQIAGSSVFNTTTTGSSKVELEAK